MDNVHVKPVASTSQDNQYVSVKDLVTMNDEWDEPFARL